MNETSQRVTTADQDIPFGRMVVLSFKWAVAALPALIFLYFVLGLLVVMLSAITQGPKIVDAGQMAEQPVSGSQ